MLVYIIIISIIALLFMYALYKAAVVKLRTRKKNIIEQLVISKECAYGKDKDAFDEIIAIVRSKRKPSPAFVVNVIEDSSLSPYIMELEVRRFNRYFSGKKLKAQLVNYNKCSDKKDSVDKILDTVLKETGIEIEE